MNITNKDIMLSGALNEKQVQLLCFEGEEKLSALFEFKLVLNCKGMPPTPDKIIGKSLTLEWQISSTKKRYFNGIITEFTYAKEENRFVYYMTLSPKLWLLNFRKNCRIFSDQYSSITKIITQLLKEHQIEHQLKLTENYPKNEYCVQYQESDFNFLTRLLEQAGIFYYFEHQNNKHIMILTDNNQVYKDFSDDLKIGVSSHHEEQLYEWEVNYQFYPGKYTSSDHDFTQPDKQLLSSSQTKAIIAEHDHYEIYRYPGHYQTNSEGTDITSLRLAQNQIEKISGSGKSSYALLNLCHRVQFSETNYLTEKSKKYVVTKIHHEIRCAENNAENFIYINHFHTISAEITFRPALQTPKPRAPNSQIAVVIGPSGEEIYTDSYGRLKVHFYWDRDNKSNEKNACWIRSIQQWEGLLRVGTPVLIGFIDADIDHPVILGPLHDGKLMPLHTLDAEKTKSSLKRRTINKSNEKKYNEICFEDKQDQEQFYMYASKDLLNVVENDYTLKIKGNMNIEVDGVITIQGKQGITMKSPNAEINQQAMTIHQEATTKLTSKAALQSIESDGLLTLKGGLIKEN